MVPLSGRSQKIFFSLKTSPSGGETERPKAGKTPTGRLMETRKVTEVIINSPVTVSESLAFAVAAADWAASAAAAAWTSGSASVPAVVNCPYRDGIIAWIRLGQLFFVIPEMTRPKMLSAKTPAQKRNTNEHKRNAVKKQNL